MPRESKAARRERTAAIIATLQQRYPDARCALAHRTPLQLLVATILSAQCTDERVNIVTKDLFKTYKTAADFAAADPATFEQQIRSTGFYRNKAKNILAAARRLVDNFDGTVPRTMDELLTLPGIARKSANVILGTAYGANAGIVVDTHVRRVAQRLDLTRQKEPVKIERDLMDLVPRDLWTDVSHMIIFHGRQCCTARKPDCADCTVSELCPSAFTLNSKR
ncbi:MAG: endonuclease III [Planctomycetota bacterium]